MKIFKNCTLLFSVISNLTFAQQFVNGDLNGTIFSHSSLPNFWQNVPFNDPNCQASGIGQDSPDLTDIILPDAAGGIIGNPYSGTTFVSGLRAETGSIYYWQEGIMQTVSGFNIGQIYTIYFHQAVVKQSNAIDSSGSWAVYIDSQLAGVTPRTHSSAAYNSTSFNWEAVNVTFTASSTSHVIKFLPEDDDTNIGLSTTDSSGALRMGIDDIYIDSPVGIEDLMNSKSNYVYPNPFNQSTTIRFSNTSKENCSLVLYDNTGRISYQEDNITSDKIILEKNGLENGLYYFTIKAKNIMIMSGKLKIE